MLVRVLKGFTVLGRTRCATSTVESRHGRAAWLGKGACQVLPASKHDRMRGLVEEELVAPVDYSERKGVVDK
jgi:hypothetical protein